MVRGWQWKNDVHITIFFIDCTVSNCVNMDLMCNKLKPRDSYMLELELG